LSGSWALDLRADGLRLAAVVVLAAVLHLMDAGTRVRTQLVGWPPAVQGIAYGVAAVAVVVLSPATERFIYLQF
jgi:hypothetical protein